MKQQLIVFGVFLLFAAANSSIRTLLVSDGQSNKTITECISFLRSKNFSVVYFEVKPSERFRNFYMEICGLLQRENGFNMILDYSTSPLIGATLNSFSQDLHIPHLKMNSPALPQFEHQYQLLTYPGALLQLAVLKEFLRKENANGKWQNAFLILPSKSNDLKNIASVIQNAHQSIVLREWTHSMETNSRVIDGAIRTGINSFIVGLGSSDLKKFFQLLSARSLMTRNQHFLLIQTEITEDDFKVFAYSGASIFFFKPIISPGNESLMMKLTKIASELSLPLNSLTSGSPRCPRTPWLAGKEAMSQIMKSAQYKFDVIDEPDSYTAAILGYNVQVLQMTDAGPIKVYTWNRMQGMVVIRQHYLKSKDKKRVPKYTAERNLIVTTIISPPFVYFTPEDDNGKAIVGNARFQGLSIQIFDLIAKALKINYTIVLVRDGKYGSLVRENSGTPKEYWTGMIGEIMTGVADIAVSPMTITYARERVVDFSRGYIQASLGVLLLKPRTINTPINYLFPFSSELWILIVAASVITSIVLYLTAHISPSEWHRIEASEINEFTFANSLWLITGAFMLRGSSFSPKSTGTRLVCIIWCVFILLLVLTYIAVILPNITSQKMQIPITTMEDLADQTKIKYGTIYGGSSYNQFRYSPISVYKRMFESMQKHASFSNSIREGIRRVHEGNYAFIVESTTSSFYVARNCNLMAVGSSFGIREYGFAFSKGSPYRDAVSSQLQRLIESQYVDGIINYWMNEHKIRYPCSKDVDNQMDHGSLSVYLLSRLFWALGAGLLISFIVCICETCCRSFREKDRGQMTSTEYLKKAFCSWGSKRKSPSKSTDQDVEVPLNDRRTVEYYRPN